VRIAAASASAMMNIQDPAESLFVIPQPDGAPSIKLTGLTSFVTTKAAAGKKLTFATQTSRAVYVSERDDRAKINTSAHCCPVN
jgi:hypothetical protein